MNKLLLAIFISVVFLASPVMAAEPVPFKDFISITENVLDALDEVETVFSSADSMKIEAKIAFKKFDISMKKYDRHIKAWPECKQGMIAWKMESARLLYDIALLEGAHGKSNVDADKAVQEARDLFAEYKKLNK